MSDVEGLLALYGAIDQAIAADPHRDELVAKVAPLLSAYGHGAVGWYEQQYVPWADAVRRRAERRAESEKPRLRPRISPRSRFERLDKPVPPILPIDRPAGLSPGADGVFQALTLLGPRSLEGRMVSRRLLAVTVASRVFPDIFAPDASLANVAYAPLAFRLPGEDADDTQLVERAELLHKTFVDGFRSMSDWPAMVDSAIGQGLLPESFRSQEAAPPCTGRLILRPHADGKDPDPVLVLEAGFTTKPNTVTFAEAKNYLVPSNWTLVPDSLWCRMEEYGPAGKHYFHETVSTSCPPSPGGWVVNTDLEFWFSHPTPTEARAEYDFAPGQPTALSDVDVDEGSLRIIDLQDGRIQVKTTKRVRFTGSFDGPGLAMFMCATGYSSALEDMVFSVAKSSLGNIQPFPVPAPQGVTVSPPQNPKKTTSTGIKASSTGSSTGPNAGAVGLDAIIAEAAAFVQAQVKDVADTCTKSLKSIEAGTYKVEDAWTDGLKMWSSAVANMSKALDLGTRAAKAVADKSPTDGY